MPRISYAEREDLRDVLKSTYQRPSEKSSADEPFPATLCQLPGVKDVIVGVYKDDGSAIPGDLLLNGKVRVVFEQEHCSILKKCTEKTRHVVDGRPQKITYGVCEYAFGVNTAVLLAGVVLIAYFVRQLFGT